MDLEESYHNDHRYLSFMKNPIVIMRMLSKITRYAIVNGTLSKMTEKKYPEDADE